VFTPRVSVDDNDTLDDGWYAYFRLRSANAAYRPRSSRLDAVRVDGTIMPGMFYRGVNQPIPIVRPKVN
jgi:hypothetical protein